MRTQPRSVSEKLSSAMLNSAVLCTGVPRLWRPEKGHGAGRGLLSVQVHGGMEKYRFPDAIPGFPADHSFGDMFVCTIFPRVHWAIPRPPPALPQGSQTPEHPEPLGTKLRPAVSPLPVCWSYLFYGRDTVHSFLLSRAREGTRGRGNLSQADQAQVLSATTPARALGALG